MKKFFFRERKFNSPWEWNVELFLVRLCVLFNELFNSRHGFLPFFFYFHFFNLAKTIKSLQLMSTSVVGIPQNWKCCWFVHVHAHIKVVDLSLADERGTWKNHWENVELVYAVIKLFDISVGWACLGLVGNSAERSENNAKATPRLTTKMS